MREVGDEVVVVESPYGTVPVGTTGTIVDTNLGVSFPYTVYVEAEADTFKFATHELGTPERRPAVYQDNNPKTAMGALKLPLHLVPPSATHYLAKAFADGAKKYDPYNWRSAPVSVSTYYGAAKRHEDAFWDGEDVAQDSLVEHLAHAMACYAILLDAAECGTLIDDRPTKGTAAQIQKKWLEEREFTGQFSKEKETRDD